MHFPSLYSSSDKESTTELEINFSLPLSKLENNKYLKLVLKESIMSNHKHLMKKMLKVMKSHRKQEKLCVKRVWYNHSTYSYFEPATLTV